ncbi:transglycosylase domain-containing protein [Ureibacillus acetophenoni]|uniref:Penicillin-binding protein 1A n=1 Tax=Ureibacillus acetophenoni TaxID=614649 RepID=A0A285ULT1_9BACL|nr:transglycosylase domain-containing protein [Ureibacillus acetophenoni]SOC41211.1 penicillin-binding protein 1A [Ureibacillus acetophenoni]
MKQLVGVIIIVITIPILLLLGNGLVNEFATFSVYENQLNEDIQLPEIKSTLPAKMFDRNGNVFNEEYVEWREPIQLEDVPEIIKQIYILSEDTEFYRHIGFDLSAIARAFVVNTSSESIEQGGSTITQQLVRLRYLTTEKTYERKLMELYYAYKLEQLYNKESILEMYLNEMYFGNQVYGIGSAATYYFQKPLEQLSIAQMAFIAAIPNNPSLYDPLTNFENTKARQERLIDILAENNIIPKEEATTYKQEKITLTLKSKIAQHPAYSTYVLEELKWLIAYKEGLDMKLEQAQSDDERKAFLQEIETRYKEVLDSGIEIHTALDAVKQEEDQQKIDSLLWPNNLQASAVVIDNQTREIVSLYAGKHYKKFEFNRAFQATRQPGSSFKPLIVYAPLFETTNYKPSSIVSGGSICIGNFCPQNYGGAIYGNVSITTAFKHSYNTSAVRLLNSVGIETSFQYLDRFQFSSLVDQDHSYAAALGGLTYGVSTLEMADAFSSFIDGSYKRAHSIRKVTDLEGNILYSWPQEKETIWSPHTVQYMRSLLSEVVRSGTGVGLYSNTSYIGAKTGTTNDYRDYWLAGLTDEYTSAVWIGFDQPKNMYYLEDDQIHYKIFNAIMH